MTFIQSPNYNKGRKKKIQGIVLHTIVGSAASAIATFKNPASQVSAHYVIAMNGNITQMVNDGDTAWHAGRNFNNNTIFQGNANDSTIGIEHDDGGDPTHSPRSEALYQSSGKLVGDLCRKHGIPIDRTHIVGHREIYGVKSCPGNLDMDKIINIAKQGGGDQVDKRQAVKLIYIASRGHDASGQELDFAMNYPEDRLGELAELRFKDDVVGPLWDEGFGKHNCPKSEKEFWLNHSKTHPEFVPGDLAIQWYNDHVKPQIGQGAPVTEDQKKVYTKEIMGKIIDKG